MTSRASLRSSAHLRSAIMVLLCLLPLWGCTRVSTSGQPALHSATIHGVVRYAIPNDLNTLNPVLGGLAYENAIEEVIFNGLVKLDDQQRLIPDLATEVPSRANGGISANGTTITYHLRRGVKWQDGAPFTSADVVFTFAKIMDPNVNASSSAPYTHIASITAPDDYTAVVHLKEPWAPAIAQLFCNGEQGSIIPKHLLQRSADFNRDSFGIHPIGTGPMRLARWDRGAQLVLVPNPHYFAGAPKIQRLVIPIIPDANTRLTTLTSHELDFATVGNPSQVANLRAVAGLKVLLVKNYYLYFLSINVTRPPLDDVRVRRALAMAMDRSRLTQTTFLGSAIPADSDIPPFSWAYERNNGSPPYDLAQANRLLDSDGWRAGSDGVRRKGNQRLSFGIMTVSGSAIGASLAEQLQQAWRALGIDTTVRPEPLNVQRSPTGALVTGAFDTALSGFIYDPDPDRSTVFGSQYIGARGFNESRYISARSDQLTNAAVSVYEREKRKPLYAQLQRLWNRDLPIIPIAWVDNIDAINSDLHGFKPEPVNSDFWNIQQWQI